MAAAATALAIRRGGPRSHAHRSSGQHTQTQRASTQPGIRLPCPPATSPTPTRANRRRRLLRPVISSGTSTKRTQHTQRTDLNHETLHVDPPRLFVGPGPGRVDPGNSQKLAEFNTPDSRPRCKSVNPAGAGLTLAGTMRPGRGSGPLGRSWAAYGPGGVGPSPPRRNQTPVIPLVAPVSSAPMRENLGIRKVAIVTALCVCFTASGCQMSTTTSGPAPISDATIGNTPTMPTPSPPPTSDWWTPTPSTIVRSP